jgi:hypothetical protein
MKSTNKQEMKGSADFFSTVAKRKIIIVQYNKLYTKINMTTITNIT